MKQYTIFLKYILLSISLFFIFRLYLVSQYDINVDLMFFIYSLRMDLIIVSSLLLIPVLLITFNMFFLTRLFLTLSIFILIYLEFVNVFFFDEFNTRLNYLVIEYLDFPKVIIDMIIKSYLYEIIIFFPILIFASYKSFVLFKIKKVSNIVLKKILFLPFLILILLLGARSSIDSSTPNQSFYSYSNSTIKNDITNNTIFSLAYAIYLKSKDKMPNFGPKEDNLILKLQGFSKNNYVNKNSLVHEIKSNKKKKENVVLVVMEGFGNSYVGVLGGKKTSPKFDAMSKDGLFMSNMYSSSTRTNRGLEAILTSLYPVTSNTYLKLPKSQNQFWTLAKTMEENGYETIFLYGGDSKFDNMKGFVLNNGFSKVIDKYDFDSNIKRYTWGVSDEELYKKANEILSTNNKPKFLVMLTLSSHKPFDYPANKIEYLVNEKIESFANSMKYADYALGGFYNKLKENNFFENSLLAVVADHNAHMFGNILIPANEYKIPALFISNDIKAKEIKNVTHQIDMAPTLLYGAGINARIPAMGRNLHKEKNFNALIAHKNVYTYLKDNSFIIVNNDSVQRYNYKYEKMPKDENIEKEALIYIYGSYEIYNKQLHKDTFEKH